ncbi:MAG: hypothetical protein ACI9YH_003115 [Colwellia sp.]|jgi:hypothetical protein
MDFLTASILSGMAYDMVCTGIKFTVSTVKEGLKTWVIDDAVASVIADELTKLELSEDNSPKYIEKQINNSQELLTILEKIQPTQVINQTSYGSGDNIGRDKIINHK